MIDRAPDLAENREPVDEGRRARIPDAALSAFALVGFHRASTNAIATPARVARGFVFHHSGSREAFFDEVGAQGGDAMQRVVQQFDRLLSLIHAGACEEARVGAGAFPCPRGSDRMRRGSEGGGVGWTPSSRPGT